MSLLVGFRVLSLRGFEGKFSQLLSKRGLSGGARSELRLRFTRVRRSDRIRNDLADLVGELACLVARDQLDDVRHDARGNANQRIYLPLPSIAGSIARSPRRDNPGERRRLPDLPSWRDLGGVRSSPCVNASVVSCCF